MKKVFFVFLLLFSIQLAAQNRTEINTLPVAVSPSDGSVLQPGQLPEFSWRSVQPASPNLKYKLLIVEVTGTQPVENAISGNKPYFEKDSIKATKQPYPPTARAFVEGKNYAWVIQCVDNTGKPVGPNNGYSKPMQFSVQRSKVGIK
jgi:hypothetical protein